MMKAISSFETSVLTRATQPNIPQNSSLHSHSRENLNILIILSETLSHKKVNATKCIFFYGSQFSLETCFSLLSNVPFIQKLWGGEDRWGESSLSPLPLLHFFIPSTILSRFLLSPFKLPIHIFLLPMTQFWKSSRLGCEYLRTVSLRDYEDIMPSATVTVGV
jgi:hypothetical protein